MLSQPSAMPSQNHHKFPPKAKKIPKKLKKHGHIRTDNYCWLNERENPEVVAYLKEENDYTETVFNTPTKELQKTLFDEMVGRIPQKDVSVPYTLRGYSYYTRYEEGKEYPVYCRKKTEKNAPEEIMLDGNKMAEGHHFFEINNWEISPDNQIIAYSVDTVSRRQYTIFFKNLKTGKTYPDKIPNTSGDLAWSNNNRTIFYSVKDTALRPYKIFRHTLGELVENDRLIFHEKDASFDVSVYKSKSKKFMVITSESTLSTEYQLLDADKPDGKFNVFTPRMKNVEYHIAHQGNRFLIRTNYKAKNFRLMETPMDKTGVENWKELIPNRKDVLLEEVEVFDKFFVVAERKNGLLRFRVFNMNDGTDHYLQFDEPDYHVYFDDNYAYE
ncbi:MAG TPA: S9 family peptidase, partial [Bacteroidetes bacterium]|nr:S9 family peptidase [Bacteroidota bacterium]